ncbi:MAG: hypothetical protein J2P29_16375, partial [Actinobacteria bacterium]|nr:hypothetical protein [Actinomycetota bacterium]
MAAYQLNQPQPDSLAGRVTALSEQALVPGSGEARADGAGDLATSAGHARAVAPASRHTSAAAPRPTAAPSPPPPPCAANSAGASGPVPANYAAIVDFLATHGYTKIAAA